MDEEKGYYDSAGCWNWIEHPFDEVEEEDEPFNLDWLFEDD